MRSPDDSPLFEQVSWDDVESDGSALTAERVTLVVGLLLVAAVYWYDTAVAHVYLVSDWKVSAVQWVFMLATVVLVAFGVIPVLRRRDAVRRVLGRLRAKPLALFSGGFLAAVVVVGLVGPVVVPYTGLRFGHAYQPPFGFSTGVMPFSCIGEITGSIGVERCHGTAYYPFGTNRRGLPMDYLLVTGARITLNLLVITAAFVVPLAVAVGVVAGLRGGLVDDLLMAYVDVQLCVPAIMVYFIGYIYWNPSLLLLILAFGLLSWGGVARIVRSEVLQRRENGHVLVARSQGASKSYIARNHILPNATNTVVPAVFHLLGLLVLAEAGVAFLGFHEIDVYSWGSTMSESLNAAVGGQLQSRAEYPAYEIWWVSTFPAVALALTLASLKVLGDALRDALDPRGER